MRVKELVIADEIYRSDPLDGTWTWADGIGKAGPRLQKILDFAFDYFEGANAEAHEVDMLLGQLQVKDEQLAYWQDEAAYWQEAYETGEEDQDDG